MTFFSSNILGFVYDTLYVVRGIFRNGETSDGKKLKKLFRNTSNKRSLHIRDGIGLICIITTSLTSC